MLEYSPCRASDFDLQRYRKKTGYRQGFGGQKFRFRISDSRLLRELLPADSADGRGFICRALPYAECHKAVGLDFHPFFFSLSPFSFFCSIMFAVFFLSLLHIYIGEARPLALDVPPRHSQLSTFNFQFSIEVPLLVSRSSSYSFLGNVL